MEVLDFLQEIVKGLVARWEEKQSKRESIAELLVRLSLFLWFRPI